jgi:hypothetical protein
LTACDFILTPLFLRPSPYRLDAEGRLRLDRIPLTTAELKSQQGLEFNLQKLKDAIQ